MPADEISISETTTPTMTSAPPPRRPDSTVGIAAGRMTRTRRWLSVAPMLHAASSSCGSMVWIPAAVASMVGRKAEMEAVAVGSPGGGGEHGVQKAVDQSEGFLVLRADAEPHGKHWI